MGIRAGSGGDGIGLGNVFEPSRWVWKRGNVISGVLGFMNYPVETDVGIVCGVSLRPGCEVS
jgi:hypothetical protein